MSAQANAFERGVPTARVIRLPHANPPDLSVE